MFCLRASFYIAEKNENILRKYKEVIIHKKLCNILVITEND